MLLMSEGKILSYRFGGVSGFSVVVGQSSYRFGGGVRIFGGRCAI